MQIRQHNIYHTNVIVIKDKIISKKALEKEDQLVMRNIDKTTLAEIKKISRPIDLDGKYIWAISNVDIDATRDLGLTAIIIYWRFADQIEKEVNGLYKDWILAFATFVKYFRKTHNNKKVTEKMKIR